MNQSSSQQWLRLCTLVLSLVVGSLSIAAQQQPTAAELHAQGSELYEQGRILEARDLLLRIDLTQLERAQRQQVLSLVSDIDRQLRAMPEAELRLRKADLAVRHEDLRTAAAHLEAVIRSEEATSEQRQQADSTLRSVRERQAEIAPTIPGLLESSITHFHAGRYAEARAGLQRVRNSGVDLDLDQQADLTRYLGQIAAIEARHGRLPEAVLDPAADPREPRPEPQAVPQPEPLPEPIEEPEQPPIIEEEPVPDQDLIFQAQLAQAQEYLAEAQAAQAEGRFRAAIALYQRVLAIQPDNPVALAGLDFSRSMIEAQPLLEDVTEQRALRAAQLRAEFNNLMEQARLRLAEGDFAGALDYVSQARIRRAEGVRDLPPAEAEAMRQETIALAEQIDQARREAELLAIQERDEAAQRELERQRVEMELRRQREIMESLTAIRRLQLAQRYEEALIEVQNLLHRDPGNPAGLALRDAIREQIIGRRYDALRREQHYRAAELQIRRYEEQMIKTEIVEYPVDWPALTIRRTGDFAYHDTEQDRRVHHALANTRVPVEFNGHPFGDVVTYIARMANINVDVDWRALEQNFIDPKMPINLRLNDQVPLKVVLERTLAQLGVDEHTRPDYAISNGILTISTRERLRHQPVMHLYPISDLLIDVPTFDNAPSVDLDTIMRRRDRRDSRFEQGRFFGENEERYDRGRDRRREIIDQIRDIITSNIDGTSWQINGGDVGVIQELNSNLIITTTARNHRDITNLLAKLREIRSLQISVESRFLSVAEDWFEQLGIDLDVFFGGSTFRGLKQDDPNLWPIDLFTDPRTGSVVTRRPQRQFGSPWEWEGTGTFDELGREIMQQPFQPLHQLGRPQFTPSGFQGGTLDIAERMFEGTRFAGEILAGAPGAGFAISFLSDIQVDLLIKATQADRRSIQLQSPKLTFFNGQRAWVAMTVQRAFISDLDPVIGDSSAGFAPVPGVLPVGVVLDVEGTISADRRYVTMTVELAMSELLELRTVAQPIVVGGRVIVGPDPIVVEGLGQIELPVTQVSQVNTTVSVPDRGTILLGGQTIRNDIQIESGVPVLSKIPVLSRFFTNRIDAVEERTLLILMRPTIIIQQENEELLFPGLTDQIRAAGGAF